MGTEIKYEICSECKGSGVVSEDLYGFKGKTKKCRRCDGKGTIRIVTITAALASKGGMA